jgi:hypothetical protein
MQSYMNKNQESMIDEHEIKATLEMLTVANEYCLFFEKAENYESGDILLYFQKIAPLLYLKASLIDPLPVNNDAYNERYVTEEQWEAVFKALREKLGTGDQYYTHDHNFDSVEASLADNFADIYQDMKDFIMLYQKNTEPARHNAIANLTDLFRWRWGPALINALGAVHQLLFKDDISPDLFQNEEESLI